ncbi:restriction endonuclease subunit S [Aeromonas fluvialis]|uniref:restriction endonuclease subunit S n=1 Tax=Aeromonas fluvialis TaxID=591962 RepID=UPI0005AAAA1B|nr:restriction endonuclease subunit S [Aeromonas fluvialis]
MIAAEHNSISKYQPYPEYKDSGVEWLGKIPNHWAIKKIAWYFKAQKGRNAQMLTKEFCGDNPGDFPVYSGQTENDGVMGSINSYEFDSAQDGCLFATTVGAKAMTLSFLKGKFSLSQNCMVIIPTSDVIDTRFYFYHCQPLFSYERGLIPEHMQASFRMEDLYQYQIAMPNLQEQQTIAAFLDYETARIDRLIAQQQRLIELLKEKRQAVISHAVTKGLNPNAPMKDSGVEWLGQVPEHWIVRRLKHHIISMDQGWSPQCEARLAEEDEFGVMKVGCVNGGVFRFSEHKALPAELEPKTEYRLKKGQLLVSRANTRELVGSAAVVDDDYDQLLLCDKLYRIKLSSGASPEFVALLLGTSAYRGQIELSASGASDSMQNIGQSTIKELPIAVPPMDEANDILKYVAARLCTFDCLNNQLQQQNLLLQERRIALISAAVTGKIDLRGWTPPSDEEAA